MIGSLFCSLGKALGACEIKTPPLTYWGDMDVYEVSSILIEKFQDAPLYLPDAYYKTCSKLDMERFLDWDMTNRERFETDSWDCDDFSWRLKGNITIKPWSSVPFFVVWTDLHALNGFISEDRKWHFVEPQTDTIHDSLEAWQGSQIRFIGG